MGCKDCAKGAVKLAKAVFGFTRADAPTVKRRRDICRECEHATRSANPAFASNKGLTTLSRCQLCTCFIAAKTALREEACPVGKWTQAD